MIVMINKNKLELLLPKSRKRKSFLHFNLHKTAIQAGNIIQLI